MLVLFHYNFWLVNGIEFCGVLSKYSSELVKLGVYGLLEMYPQGR